MSNQIDPRGEYTRVCPYCKESFIADHLSRFYCPEKNGIQNQCKHRQKRIMDKIRKEGGVVPVHKSNPIEVVFKDRDLRVIDVDRISKEAQLYSNIKVLKELLGDKTSIEISPLNLLENGFDKEFFEGVEDTPIGIKVFKIGVYVFHKIPNNNNIYITLKQNYNGAN